MVPLGATSYFAGRDAEAAGGGLRDPSFVGSTAPTLR